MRPLQQEGWQQATRRDRRRQVVPGVPSLEVQVLQDDLHGRALQHLAHLRGELHRQADRRRVGLLQARQCAPEHHQHGQDGSRRRDLLHTQDREHEQQQGRSARLQHLHEARIQEDVGHVAEAQAASREDADGQRPAERELPRLAAHRLHLDAAHPHQYPRERGGEQGAGRGDQRGSMEAAVSHDHLVHQGDGQPGEDIGNDC
mmetsp:Transcript_121557/g.340402  ORF Transcript_121557/g.340402 Transcript_121557/m.340402 type:complete len:203 (+) Transcript_121557:167-775(+)